MNFRFQIARGKYQFFSDLSEAYNTLKRLNIRRVVEKRNPRRGTWFPVIGGITDL